MPRMVGYVAFEHRLARCPTQGDFKVRKESPPAPDGERPAARPIFTHLRHERVLHAECVSQMAHERGKKSLTRLCFDAFNDHAQGGFCMGAINNLQLRCLVNPRRFGRLLLNLTKLNPHFFRHVLNPLYGRYRR